VIYPKAKKNVLNAIEVQVVPREIRNVDINEVVDPEVIAESDHQDLNRQRYQMQYPHLVQDLDQILDLPDINMKVVIQGRVDIIINTIDHIQVQTRAVLLLLIINA
jgi:BioD-like phosphotransacetylase family protein